MGAQQSTVKITSQDRAVLDLKLQRDKLKQYQKKIEYVLKREEEIAKEALEAGNKSRALTALRQRKYQQQLLLRTDTQLETLQSLVSSIEFSLVEKSVFEGLKQGNQVLKEIHSEMTLEKVEKLMGETEEAVSYQREIDQALQSKMSVDEEEAVQNELNALIDQQEQTRVPAVPDVELPQVPTTEPVVNEAEELERTSPEPERKKEERQMVAA
ncbi:snf7 family charged multivesicular body protein 6 [Phaffia rhodozyma]|uniref:Snf7 family charged multivesicular body protein 6 n=1 Tax=Phaffia rhodozyma TaxID=264483 RepID=A0A0F7SJB2_PHARH|nr:snf7 family charged multivesicular body protein 6 [Phaffia rhodozyma]